MSGFPEGLRLELRREDLVVGWRLYFRVFDEYQRVIGFGYMVNRPGHMTPQVWEAYHGLRYDTRWGADLVPLIEDEALARRLEWL